MGVLLTGGVCQDPIAGGSETDAVKWKKRHEAVQRNKETVWAAPAPPPHPCAEYACAGEDQGAAVRAGWGRVFTPP